MSHKSKQTLNQQVYDALQDKQGFGRSKHQDKQDGVDGQYIYSFSTMKTYIKHCNYFTDWCKEQPAIRDALGHKPRTLDECKPYVEQFIKYQEDRGLSAYTVKMEVSALGKLYGQHFDIETKGIRRADITRSRGDVVRDAHFSESRNADFVNFCRCTGVRRSEYEKAKPSDLTYLDGQPFLYIVGKGGRERLAPIVGTAEQVASAIAYLKGLNGSNKGFGNADIHSYRSDYATAIYKANCPADLSVYKGVKIDYTELTGKHDKHGQHIYKSALYVCRGDRKGEAMYRPAMLEASKALGHNRESVVGEHYIR